MTPEPSTGGSQPLPTIALAFQELSDSLKLEAGPLRAATAWRIYMRAVGDPHFYALHDYALENNLVVDCYSTDPSVQNLAWMHPIDGSEMIWIPPGPFRYGPKDARAESKGFSLGRWPVTNSQFAQFLSATGYKPPQNHANNELFLAHWRSESPPPALAQHPVVFVSHFDALAYCEWAALDLPTEGLWEKAARGADGRTYPWGEQTSVGSRYTLAHMGVEGTCEVGRYSQVRSPYGCEELIGNVSEWCHAVADGVSPGEFPSPTRDVISPATGDLTLGVVRGACFLRSGNAAGKATHRRRLTLTRRNKWTGFRVASLLAVRPVV